MSTNTSDNIRSRELDDLAKQIKSWREHYPNKYISKILWRRVLNLIEYHSIEEISKRTDLELRYLRRKLKQMNPDLSVTDIAKVSSPQFVEIPAPVVQNILNVKSPLTLSLRNISGVQIDLAFTGDVQEVLPFIKEVIQGGEPCSK